MKNFNLIIVAALSILFCSCSNEDPTLQNDTPVPEGDFTDGFFVLNEGGFTYNNASVSFVNDQGEVFNNIFSSTNNRNLGDVAQSMSFYDELALVVLNYSNTIEVVNRYTFESVASIEDQILNPRYASIVGDKAYITNWGDPTDIEDDYVAILDLNTFTIQEKIEVVEGPEKIVEADGKLYVAHKGGWGYGHEISVIDLSTNTVQSKIEVSDVPDGMLHSEGYLYVLSSGKASWTGEVTKGGMFKINTSNLQIEEEFDFPDGDHPKFLVEYDNSLHYILGRDIFRVEPSNFNLPNSPFISTADQDISVLYGFNIHKDTVYVADAKDYVSNGEVHLYNTSGEHLTKYGVRLIPNGFYFN
ncbi:YncE family protein [Psychroflexus tropicus]|uniref:YncE family protein n=1 Tax=Psychroflexus tropicus TaxID=197345 RepID=UPI00037EA530|nr:DUF5074 domain-containing protein [Psychroflexus tropicus]